MQEGQTKRRRQARLDLCQSEVFRRAMEYAVRRDGPGLTAFACRQSSVSDDVRWLLETHEKSGGEEEDDDPRGLVLRAMRDFKGEERIALLQRAYESSRMPLAACFLGKIYYSGINVTPSDSLARKWFMRAENLGEALYYLARMANDDASFMERAAHLDYPEAQRFFAQHCGENNRRTEEMQWLGRAALNGSSAAQLRIRSIMAELFDNREREEMSDDAEVAHIRRLLSQILSDGIDLFERTLYGMWASEDELNMAQQMIE